MAQIHYTCMLAMSLDSRIGTHALESDEQRTELGLSSKEDHLRLLQEISASDAIVIGANSIRANQGKLPGTEDESARAHWYILATKPCSIHPESQGKATIVSPSPINAASNLTYGEESSAVDWLDSYFHTQRYKKILVLGGETVYNQYLSSQIVKRLLVTICPVIIGTPNAPSFFSAQLPDHTRWKLLQCDKIDQHIFLEYQHENHTTPQN